ncbi:MAG TPA: NUDIX domain-containing protein [Nevskiaceae bacterium]
MPGPFRWCPCCAAPLALVEHDGVPRLACTRCDFVRWENPTPVVAAIVEHEGCIVLGRNALWPAGMFALITGFMEKFDASPREAALREVKEELDLDGEIAGFVGHYRFERMNQLIIAFHVRAHGRIRLDPELVEYRRCAPEALRPWPGATGSALRDWMLARGLAPLPYIPEALRLIDGYRYLGARVSAGGRPRPLQFKALAMARVQDVVALAPADDEERRLVEANGMRYHAVPVVGSQVPAVAQLAALRGVLTELQTQRIYVHDGNGTGAVALAFLHSVLVRKAALGKARAALSDGRALPPEWAAFIARELAEHGIA